MALGGPGLKPSLPPTAQALTLPGHSDPFCNLAYQKALGCCYLKAVISWGSPDPNTHLVSGGFGPPPGPLPPVSEGPDTCVGVLALQSRSQCWKSEAPFTPYLPVREGHTPEPAEASHLWPSHPYPSGREGLPSFASPSLWLPPAPLALSQCHEGKGPAAPAVGRCHCPLLVPMPTSNFCADHSLGQTSPSRGRGADWPEHPQV